MHDTLGRVCTSSIAFTLLHALTRQPEFCQKYQEFVQAKEKEFIRYFGRDIAKSQARQFVHLVMFGIFTSLVPGAAEALQQLMPLPKEDVAYLFDKLMHDLIPAETI